LKNSSLGVPVRVLSAAKCHIMLILCMIRVEQFVKSVIGSCESWIDPKQDRDATMI
jgi:hypothetical protein